MRPQPTSSLQSARAAATTPSRIQVVPSVRLLWADLLRAVAALWVVTIHVSAVPMAHLQALAREWWWALGYNAISRAAGPTFVMLSGAFLLTRPQWEGGEFFRKRGLKLLPPLIAWTLLYIGWRMALREDHFTVTDVARHLLDGSQNPAYPHLWFLWIIFILYLLAPVLRPFVVHSPLELHLYFAGLWLFATALFPILAPSANVSMGLHLDTMLGFVGYFVVGASIRKYIPPKLSGRWIVLAGALFLGGFLVAVFGTASRTEAGGKGLDEFLLTPLAGNVAAMSIAAFLLFRHVATTTLRKGHGRMPALITFAGTLTFGIYLIHPMVIDVFDLLGLPLNPLPFHPSWYVPMVSIAVFVTSAAAVAALRKTKVFAWLVP